MLLFENQNSVLYLVNFLMLLLPLKFTISSVLCMIVFIEAGTILGLIVLCAMSVYFLMYWPKRHYVLARDRRAFQYYIGGNLVMQSHLHNICILLKQSYAADGRRWAHLEISGYKLEATRISGNTVILL